MWTLSELTELDFRLQTLPADSVKVQAPAEDMSRDACLLAWLRRREVSADKARQAALLAVRSEQWLRVSLMLLSFVSGAAAAIALLWYDGQRLINVATYVLVLAGGQLLLLLFTLLSALLLRTGSGAIPSFFLPAAVRTLSMPQSLPAWKWRLFNSFQLSGVAFNLGVLSATLTKVLTSDLAFGWATTLEISSERIHRLVQTMATPWGGAWTPGVEQIEQSRIILLADLSGVDTRAVTAWWPFIVLCVVFYGLLPRLLTLAAGHWTFRRILTAPRLDSPEVERLVQRLTRPPLHFQSSTVDSSSTERSASESGDPLAPLQPCGPLRVHIPKDVAGDTDRESLKTLIQSRLDLPLSDQGQGVLQVVEVWQPPLEETLEELRELRIRCGPEADILLLAVGVPPPEGSVGFEPPSENDLRIWSRHLRRLKDPRLGMLPWPGGVS